MQNNTFSTLFVGQNLIKLTEVDSTNNFMKLMVSNSEPLPEGTVIMADHQFAGRGQQGNTWFADPGANLTFSLFLKPVFLSSIQQFLLNIAISIGVCNVLKNILGSSIKIKWPNDFYYEDKKIGGMLVENTISGTQYKTAIIGIGINVNQINFDETIKDKATSILQILKKEVRLDEILPMICSSIEAKYIFLRAGGYSSLREEYLKSLYLYKEDALYLKDDKVFEGQIVNVTEQGLLVLLTNDLETYHNFKEIAFLNR